MKYCSQCGHQLAKPAKNNLHLQCEACKFIHYQNPAVLVSVFLYHQDKLFLIKRGTEPSKGQWTFPAGFLEPGETPQQAAVRELREETTLDLPAESMIPLGTLSVLPMHQLYLLFRCHCETALTAQVTEEVAEWGWFNEADAPWDTMAYNNSEYHIRQSYRWLKNQQFPFCIGHSTADKITCNIYGPKP